VNNGPGQAKKFLATAGSPTTKDEAKEACMKYLNARSNSYDRLVASNPGKYGKYLKGWKSRIDRLRSFVDSV
jgi:hypothetical protein